MYGAIHCSNEGRLISPRLLIAPGATTMPEAPFISPAIFTLIAAIISFLGLALVVFGT